MEIEIINAKSSTKYAITSFHYVGKNDSFSILNNHAPLIKIINGGYIKTKGANKIDTQINSAIVKVLNNYITLIEI